MLKRLLIITQKVDESDNNLGFFPRWIEEFAKHVSRVTVICLEEGVHNFSKNVSVRSLGKEKGHSRLKIALTFVRYIVQFRREYDAVFVHMNPEYVLLGGALWRLFRKEVGFWYTHQSERLLRSALLFVGHVFTPSKDSFPIPTKKARVVGHGVDTNLFSPRAQTSNAHSPVILSDTRLTPSKHVEQTLELSAELLKWGVLHTVQIIGAAITKEDREYEKKLRARVETERLPVTFVGGVPFNLVPDYYGKADLFVNHANVGALNKTVLQAMAMNIPVITSNESYRKILPDEAIVPEDPKVFADKIQAYLKSPSPVSYRERILRDHSLHALIPKILRYYV